MKLIAHPLRNKFFNVKSCNYSGISYSYFALLIKGDNSTSLLFALNRQKFTALGILTIGSTCFESIIVR